MEQGPPALVRWLVYEVPAGASAVEVLHGFASRLAPAGIEVTRVNLQTAPLSPQAARQMYRWQLVERDDDRFPRRESLVDEEVHELDGGRVRVFSFGHHAMWSPIFKASPFYRIMIEGIDEIRCAIAPDQTEFEFPVMPDLQAEGATEYLALQLRFHDGTRNGISFVTARAGGFGDEGVAALRALLPPLALALSPRVADRTLRTLLGAYLGPKTAARVLGGVVQRGDVEEIEAAVWFSDLRGFTPMSAAVAPAEMIRWLNDYFAAIGRAIAQHDGEILKFVGDAILAVWPVTPGRERAATCAAALDAAYAANRLLDELNTTRTATGLPPLHHGIGLHVGRVQYGNIGAEGRLDFTVVGPAVNTASRIEGACARMNRRVITSEDFASCVPDRVTPIGEIDLKGIAEPQRVFGVR